MGLFRRKITLFAAIWFLSIVQSESHLLEGIYCGKENCYDILGVTRETPKNEIAKKYRQLAKKYHPDLHRDPDAKVEAEEQFKRVATAYEILRDDEERADYDYMLDNPDEYYAHYYRYYRRRMAPKVDVRIVVAVTISIISIIQYYSAWQKYDTAIKHFMNVPKYRYKAMEIAKAETAELKGKSKNKKSKAEQKEELDKIVRRVIEENMDIKGSYAKPEITDILWVQIIILPYTLSKNVYWYIRWLFKFTIFKQPYGEEEKLYIIRKFMKLGTHQFNSFDESEKQDFLDQELWMKDNFLEWKEIKDEETKKALAENNKHKQYRRYIKQHGIGRMTFDDS